MSGAGTARDRWLLCHDCEVDLHHEQVRGGPLAVRTTANKLLSHGQLDLHHEHVRGTALSALCISDTTEGNGRCGVNARIYRAGAFSGHCRWGAM